MESSHYKLISLKNEVRLTSHICNTKRTEGFAEVLIKKSFSINISLQVLHLAQQLESFINVF